MEIFNGIPGYEGLYEAGNRGSIKSLGNNKFKTARILRQSITGRGYYGVVLYKNGVAKSFPVHKLVAMTFLNHIPCRMEAVINHKDFDKSNNSASNLEIVTQRENVTHTKKKGNNKYTGSYKNANGRFRATISINGCAINLGSYKNEVDAAAAYLLAASDPKNKDLIKDIKMKCKIKD